MKTLLTIILMIALINTAHPATVTETVHGNLVVEETLSPGLIDLGTNTIDDGTMTGDWDFGSGDLTTTGTGRFDGGVAVGNAPIADTVLIETSGATDPTLCLKTTNSPNQIDIHLDESATSDTLRLVGQTAAVDTVFNVIAKDARSCFLQLFSGPNKTVFQVDSNDDLIISAAGGDISFSDENITTTGNVSANTADFGDGGTTNYTAFAADGELTLNGTARVTNEIQIKAEGLKLGATAPTQAVIGNYSVLQFAGAGTTDTVYTSFHVPDEWALGTDLTVHIHWAPVNANAGNVKWQMTWDATASNANELISDAGTSTFVIDATQTLQDELLESDSMTISGASLAREDTIGIRLFRDPTDGDDTYASAASFVIMEIQYIMSRLGDPT